jgi:8-oxo-dGTP pyrophosphatase MutT (NUDIX family)
MARRLTRSIGEHAYKAQVAALPVRPGDGGLDVLLITSRETRRWVIPKGWPMKGRKDHQAAAQEALEEAGVAGKIRKQPIGAYTYQKRLIDRVEACRVMVYLLEVEKQLISWREKDQRKRQWFSQSEAADRISEPALSAMILALNTPRGARTDRKGPKGASPSGKDAQTV